MELRYNIKNSGYLEHYGVLGMKWGVRNDRTYGGMHSSILREDFSNSRKLLKLAGKASIKGAATVLTLGIAGASAYGNFVANGIDVVSRAMYRKSLKNQPHYNRSAFPDSDDWGPEIVRKS